MARVSTESREAENIRVENAFPRRERRFRIRLEIARYRTVEKWRKNAQTFQNSIVLSILLIFAVQQTVASRNRNISPQLITLKSFLHFKKIQYRWNTFRFFVLLPSSNKFYFKKKLTKNEVR